MSTSKKHALLFLLAAAIILCAALWIRLTGIYNIPIFFDEGNHIVWAQRFSISDTTYPILMDGKFLLGVLLAQFGILGPSPLWLARAVVALFSLTGCAACIAIGKLMRLPRAGLLAALLCAFLPQAVFFDKQTLADPLMAGFGMLAIALTLMIVRTRRWYLTLPLAASLAAAILFKLFGFLYFIYPALAVLFLASSWKDRRQLAARYTVAFILSVLLIGAFLLALYPKLGYNDPKLAGQQIGFVGCPAILCKQDIAEQTANLKNYGLNLLNALPPYIGWPIITLSILAWPLSPAPHRKGIRCFALSSLAFLIAFSFTAKGAVPPRYMSFLSAPMAILAAVSITFIAQRVAPLTGRHSLAQFSAAALLLLSITAWPAANNVPLVVDLAKANLASMDAAEYLEKWVGRGIREAAFTVWERESESAQPPVVISSNIYLHLIGAYFDRTQVDVREGEKAAPRDVGGWLFAGQEVYIFDDVTNGGPAEFLPGLISEEVGRYPAVHTHGESIVRLRRVTGVDAVLRDEIFAEYFINPEKLPEHYKALADSLRTETGDSVVVVYPPNQLDTLNATLGTQSTISTSAVGNSWPLNVNEVTDSLSKIAAAHDNVKVVFLEETRGDPDRAIETWLNTNLFRVGEEWFGPLRVIQFANGDDVSQSIPVGARFGDGIQLDSVDVLDSAVRLGGLLRMRLNWRATAPVSQELKVFVHVFQGDGIVAQHDGQPVGELRPTTTWQSGETIMDQFAIRIPPDAKPGGYQLRIGMYDLNTQERLPVALADGTSGEFYVGGSITVK